MRKFFILAVIAQIFLLTLSVTAAPQIIDKPLNWTERREELTREYSMKHYGFSATEIIPRAVVVHWTAISTFESTFKVFEPEISWDDEVNVATQFIIDRDGTIYRITPETKLARHAIGYNHCAIGIENVGGVNNVEDLTVAQLNANVELIRYLREKYSTIEYIFGHYQQVEARESGLYIENVPDYFAGKPDPGKIFMKALQQILKDDGFKFFPV